MISAGAIPAGGIPGSGFIAELRGNLLLKDGKVSVLCIWNYLCNNARLLFLQIAASELPVIRPLKVSGGAPEVELLRLERDVARYRGDRNVASTPKPCIQSAIVEAPVQPCDIAFLHPDQEVVVKLAAHNFSIHGGLEGRLVPIGADSTIDEKGNTYCVVHVRTDKSTLGENLPATPAMIAKIDVITDDRSILTCLLKPILHAKTQLLSEQ